MNVHSYTRSKPVHGITCRGTIENESARETRAAKKQTTTDIAPRKEGTLLRAAFGSCGPYIRAVNISESHQKLNGRMLWLKADNRITSKMKLIQYLK